MKFDKFIQKPALVLPTAILFVISVIMSFNVIFIYHTYVTQYDTIWWILCTTILIFIHSLICYLQFTVAHEAVHGNISNYPIINTCFGMISTLWLSPLGYFYGFKYAHLAHHAYTNDNSRDPDMYASLEGPGGLKYLFLRWCTIDLYYIILYTKYLITRGSFTSFGYYIAYIIALVITIRYIFNNNYGMEYLLFWVISTRMSLFILSFAFDFLPHHPHIITRQMDRYKTTAYISITECIQPVASLMFMYQNYHIMHHLNTSIPFYLYGVAWKTDKEILIKDHDVPITKFISIIQEEKIL